MDNEDSFRAVADQIVEQLSVPDVTLVVSEADRRMGQQKAMFRVAVGIFAVVVAVGLWFSLSGGGDVEVAAEPFVFTEELQDLAAAQTGLSVDPERTVPGSLVEVTPDTLMGQGFTLERFGGGQWEPTVAVLIGVESTNTRGPTIVALGEDFTIDSIGFSGPLMVAIPEDAEPGLFRICTWTQSRPSDCAPLIIE